MINIKLSYAVVRFYRPKDVIQQDVIGRFRTLNDAIFFAKNVHRATKDSIESIRVWDVDSLKEHANFGGAILTN